MKRKFLACPFCCLLKGFRLRPPLYLLPSETCLVIALLVLLGFYDTENGKRTTKIIGKQQRARGAGTVARGVALCFEVWGKAAWRWDGEGLGGLCVCMNFFKEMVPENWWDVMDVARRERRDFNKGGLDVFCAWRCYQPFIWGLQIKKMNLYWKCVWGLDLVVLHGALSLNQEGHGFVSVILVMIFSVLGVKFCRPPPQQFLMEQGKFQMCPGTYVRNFQGHRKNEQTKMLNYGEEGERRFCKKRKTCTPCVSRWR